MSSTVSPKSAAAVPSVRERLTGHLHTALEVVAFLLVCFAPWPFGSVHPFFEFILFAGIGVLLALWAATLLVAWRFPWKRCSVTLCLAGLVLVGVAQLAPLPPALLRVLSPSAVQLLRDLRPASHEVMTSGEPVGPVAHAAGETLSLYPGGTRREVLRLLAVFLLFAVVRHTFASKESLRRLGFACLANGAALALFGLVQFYTTPQRHIVFWTTQTAGQVFGPFIDRNHFAFFVNVCVCLVGGLLAGYWLSQRHETDGSWFAFLQHPPSLWLGAFGLLMLVSLAFCLSRGGLLSLAIGCLAAVTVYWMHTPQRSWSGPLWVTTVLVAVGLFTWFILPRLEPRLAVLWHHDTQEGRLSAWMRALALGRDYPLAGTGYGTFGFMEMSRRSPGGDPLRGYIHAHNDYLEALAEGGLPRLLLTVAAVAAVAVLAVRAARRYREHPAVGWVLGALAGFTAVAFHSLFEFGLHTPAIAVLTAVVAAHLAALGAKRTPDNRQDETEVRLFGLGPPLAAAGLLVLAAMLVSEGWRLAQADRFRLAAEYRDLQKKAESHVPQVEYLQAAVRYAPDDATLRLRLAEAHLWQSEYTSEPGHRAAAARQLLIARDLCPVMRQPHVKLAALGSEFSSPDAPRVYVERATLLSPTDPQMWFLRGVVEQTAGDQEAAWKSWRRSLELSDRHFAEILKRLDRPDPKRVAEHLLPARPEMLAEAASLLYPKEPDEERQLLQHALALLEQQAPLRPGDMRLRGRIQNKLGNHEAALESYRTALGRDSSQTQWRFEMAELLYRGNKVRDAEPELERVLREQPDHVEARALLERIRRNPGEQID